MSSEEFARFRKKLGKTQLQMAQLLGTSVKAIHSYEQGWRRVPPHVERQLFFLVFRRLIPKRQQRACWTVNRCPAHRRKKCPAHEFNAGRLCWFINGTICQGVVLQKWKDKMAMCRGCKVFRALLDAVQDE
jgi:hypothetical protein